MTPANSHTTLIPHGLPFMLRGVAFNLGMYQRVVDATVLAVRELFLGTPRPTSGP